MPRRTGRAALAPLAALALAATLGLGAYGCAGRLPAEADPALAASAIQGTAPAAPLRVIFDWELLDGDARFRGSGAARIEPPYRLRLDLFGPRGEGYLSAALVEHELRLPVGVGQVPLPPPAMVWAALGVVSPPVDAVLAGTRVEGSRTELHYSVGGSRLRYTLDGPRLASARWDGDGRQMRLEINGTLDAGVPRSSFFRDHANGTELQLNPERVDEVEPYPAEIWFPDA